MLTTTDFDVIRAIFKDELQKAFNHVSVAQSDVMTAKQVAQMLNVTQQSVFKYAKVGLKHSKMGKNLIFKRSDVETFINEIKRPTQKELLSRVDK
jgi:predicted transcriptional regulator